MKMHVLDEHKRGVKKAFAMEALEMVALDQNYMEWLEEPALSLETNEQIKQANQTEMINSKNIIISRSRRRTESMKCKDKS